MKTENTQSQDEQVINIIESVFGNSESIEALDGEGIERSFGDFAERTLADMVERSFVDLVERC